MIIKQITLEKNHFYLLSFEGGEKVKVSEDLLVKHRLLKGEEVSQTLFEELKASAGFALGLQLAYNYVSYQLRSELEMLQYLKKKDVSSPDRKKIIERLKELKLIDDLVYAESYIRTQMRLGDKGPFYLSQQLKKKGIAENIIGTAIDLYTDEAQREVAVKTAEKNWKKNQNRSHREGLSRVRSHLIQKGFHQEVIQFALSQLPQEKDETAEWENLMKEGQKALRRQQRFPYPTRVQKIKNQLYQKGFSIDQIQQFIDEEVIDEE
ncbi:recombination regulator RecX [Enterococcus sp. LJL98]